MDEDKKLLIRDFSNYFETTQKLPPLTSKIYAYLLLDCEKKGVTFNELVETLNASKSSVSNSLTFLTQLKYIEYFTKLDERKRLYRIVPDNIILRLQGIQEMLNNEKELTRKLMDYKLKKHKNPQESSIQKSGIYIEHLELAAKQLAKTIDKLKSLNQNT
ncbi:MAG: transcriptional regulator [Moheibacter sp.]